MKIGIMIDISLEAIQPGTSLVIQWLRLHTFSAGDVDMIPGWAAKIPHAVQHDSKKETVTQRRKS